MHANTSLDEVTPKVVSRIEELSDFFMQQVVDLSPEEQFDLIQEIQRKHKNHWEALVEDAEQNLNAMVNRRNLALEPKRSLEAQPKGY